MACGGNGCAAYYARARCWAVRPGILNLDLLQIDKCLFAFVGTDGCVCGEETMKEREVVVKNRRLCRSCAGAAYYKVDTWARVTLPYPQFIPELMPV